MSNTLEYPTELGSPPIVKFDIDEHKKTQLDSALKIITSIACTLKLLFKSDDTALIKTKSVN